MTRRALLTLALAAAIALMVTRDSGAAARRSGAGRRAMRR